MPTPTPDRWSPRDPSVRVVVRWCLVGIGRNSKKRKAFSEASSGPHAIPTLYRPGCGFRCSRALGFGEFEQMFSLRFLARGIV